MFDKKKKSFGLILIGLTMLAGLFGCSDSSSNALVASSNKRMEGLPNIALAIAIL